jgi:hypothetical protein
VPPRIDKECGDSLFAKSFGGLQPVQTLYKYEARAVSPYQDRRLQALVENARRDLVYSLLFERGTSLGRNVDVSDWDGLALHHESRAVPATSIRLPRFTSSLFYLRHQCIEQRLRLLQIARIEPFGEPPVNRREQFARLLYLTLVAPEARHAHSRAEF